MTVEKPGSQWLTDVFEATSPVTRHDANMHLCCNVMIRLLHPLSIHSQTHNLRLVMRNLRQTQMDIPLQNTYPVP